MMPFSMEVQQSVDHYKNQNISEIEKQMQAQKKQREQEEDVNSLHSPFDYSELVNLQEPAKVNSEEQLSETIVFIDQPHLKVFCRDCRKQINRTTSILSGGIYRCVVCFAKTQPSQQTYQVIKGLNFPLLDSHWKAFHELLFINFIQKYGMGNWREIQDQLDFYGVHQCQEELQSHYYNSYLAQQDFIPVFLDSRQRFATNDSFFQKRCEQLKNTPINPTSIASLTTAQQNQPYEHIDSFYASHQQVHPRESTFLECYNQKRNQFEVEYDQEAQLLLAHLEFRQDDSQEETRIKFQLIDEYNRRLERRNHVKKFVLEHRLLEDDYQKQMDKNRTELEKQAFEELKPLARLTTLPQYNNLVRKVAFTKQLKSTIQGLRKFRRTHPANFKSLDEFLNSQPEESRPRKKVHNENSIKSGKKMEQMLDKHFKLSKRDFDHIVASITASGKKMVYKNVEAVLLDSNCDSS